MSLVSHALQCRPRRLHTRQLTDPAHKANPFRLYAELRDAAPVQRIKLPFGQSAWLVTRYDDVESILADERFAKDRLQTLSPIQAARRGWIRKGLNPFQWSLLDLDAADHMRQRMRAHAPFLPQQVEQLRNRVRALTNELLDRMQPRGRMDLIHDYALQVPMTIITELLGVNPEEKEWVHRWSDTAIASGSSMAGMLRTMGAAWLFRRRIGRWIRQRRRQPQDDFISRLLPADDTGFALTDPQAVSLLFLLLVAGHETTINLIGNGVLALLQHPDQLERLRSDPTLIKPAIEEILRFTSPFEVATKRFARQDITLHGVTIRRSERVLPVIAAANRDETRFADPDRFDITRDPNRHLSFGVGAHFCLGAPLARLEGQIAIQTLIERLPNLRLEVAPDQLPWRRSLVMRGLMRLPVQW